MRPRLIVIFLLIVLVPLVVLAGLGLKIASDQQEVARHQFLTLLEDRLSDVRGGVQVSLEEVERQLLGILDRSGPDPTRFREISREEPLIRQVFFMDQTGMLRFPVQDATQSSDEKDFLKRTAAIWQRQAVLYDPPVREENRRRSKRKMPMPPGRGDSLLGLAVRQPHGWIAWYWEEGLHLLFWRTTEEGVVGVEVERIVLLSQVVTRLPSGLEDGRIVLADARGDTVVQWGPLEDLNKPMAQLPLSHPLDSYQLSYFVSPQQTRSFSEESLHFTLLISLGAVVLALLSLALYFYRESSREMREASQRVNFVTQVSHELKTPLTNIRLYAELMAEDFEEEGEEDMASGACRSMERTQVIIAESQRLTRLINNILTFSKQRHNKVEIKREKLDLDRAIRSVMGQFEPALRAKGVETKVDCNAEQPVLADADAVGQILANLVSNVEKYGAKGGQLTVETSQNGEETSVIVSDRGPGIPAEYHRRVFMPFFRISNKLTDGVTGTGIGLAIARQLARLNGGDLLLESPLDGTTGARFRLTMATASERSERAGSEASEVNRTDQRLPTVHRDSDDDGARDGTTAPSDSSTAHGRLRKGTNEGSRR